MSKPEHHEAQSCKLLSSVFPYCYAPLRKQNSFRLLRLVQAKKEVRQVHDRLLALPFQATLLEYGLNDDTPYECLSYTWGLPELTHTVSIDGKYFAITKNLASALKNIQRYVKTELLWVDAICINQEDPEEREKQVGHMKTIYSRARQVLAYLGEQENSSQKMPAIFRRILAGLDKLRAMRTIKGANIVRNKIHTADLESLGLPSEDDPDWICITSFLSRPWFRRVWIIQEATVARELTFICGDWTVSRELIFHFISLGIIHALPLGHERSASAGIAIIQLKIVADIVLCGKSAAADYNSPRSSQLSILELLQSSHHENATDPRGNIYALLGLSKERKASELHPDYTEPVPDTYRRFAKYCIDAGQGSVLLERTYNPGSNLNLPSWVPDWRNRHMPFSNLAPWNDVGFGRKGLYVNAGGGFPNMRIGPCRQRLLSKGYIVDEIKIVGSAKIGMVGRYEGESTSHGGDAGFRDSLEDVLECFEEIGRFLSVRESYPNAEPKDEVLWRTLLCNQETGTLREAPAEYRTMVEALLGYFKLTSVSNPEMTTIFSRLSACLSHIQDLTANIGNEGPGILFHQAVQFITWMCLACQGRSRCLTQQGYVGQVPEITQPGDVICIIAGAVVPFTLRRKEDGYVLLGQCYLHGVMKGEILNISKYRLREIALI
jgi:hypothetical protein